MQLSIFGEISLENCQTIDSIFSISMVRPPNLQDVSKWYVSIIRCIKTCMCIILCSTNSNQSFKGSGGSPRDDFQGGHDFKVTIIVRPGGSNKAKS